jgi:hypothetical protein
LTTDGVAVDAPPLAAPNQALGILLVMLNMIGLLLECARRFLSRNHSSGNFFRESAMTPSIDRFCTIYCSLSKIDPEFVDHLAATNITAA